MDGSLKTKIVQLENLMAIMVQRGKQKYRKRIRKVIEEGAYHKKKGEQILQLNKTAITQMKSLVNSRQLAERKN